MVAKTTARFSGETARERESKKVIFYVHSCCCFSLYCCYCWSLFARLPQREREREYCVLCVPCVEGAPLQRIRFPASPTHCRLSVRALLLLLLLLLSSPASMDGWMSCWKTTGIDRTCSWRILGRDSTLLDGFCSDFGGERPRDDPRERRMACSLWSSAALTVIPKSVSLVHPLALRTAV